MLNPPLPQNMSQFTTHPALSPDTAMPTAGSDRLLTRTVCLLLLACLSMVFSQSAMPVPTLRAADLVVVDFQQDDTGGFKDTRDVTVNLTRRTGEFKLRAID